MFQKLLEADKKLTEGDINHMMKVFQNKEEVNDKSSRKYKSFVELLEKTSKKQMAFPKEFKVQPVIDEPSFRMFVSGLSGSGKSFYIANFIKNNVKKAKNIYLFSPVEEDKAFKSLKNLVQMTIGDILEETGNAEVDIEDFPKGSIVIFDDIESYNKSVIKDYLNLRNTFLERGRHLDISTIVVSHNPLAGNVTKQALRESQYFILFPRFNSRDTKVLLKTYGGADDREIDLVMNLKGRAVMYKKTVPRYVIGERDVIAL